MRVCIREPLTANRTYYVRTDGNDNNNGLENTAAGAFLTIGKAVQVVTIDLDLAGFQCVIQVGPGTYNEALQLRTYVGTLVPTIRGDNATPGNVIIAASTGNAIDVYAAWTIEGVKLTSAGGSGISCGNGASARFQNLDFGACAVSHILCVFNGVSQVLGDYQITGAAQRHIHVNGGQHHASGRTATVVGTPNFSQAFALALNLGLINAIGATYTGAATGSRYQCAGNGAMYTGGSPTFFPGSVAGTVLTGGQYY